MAKRIVIWTETAAIQRRNILRYWTIRNKSSLYAEKLIKLINENLDSVLNFPELYKLTDFPNVRVLPLGNFSLYYKVTKDRIEVVAFWDNRQDPVKLYKSLKKK